MKHWILSSILFLAISASAQNAYFNYNKGYGQLLYGNYEDAIRIFTLVIQEKSDLADAYASRGLAYHKLSQFDKAIKDYLKDNSLKKDRSSYNLACAYSIIGKKDEAFNSLEQCQRSEYKQTITTLELEPDFQNLRSDPRWKTILNTDYFTSYDKLIIQANEKFGNKEYDAAIKLCNQAITINKSDKRGYISKGYILALLGRYDESIVEYNYLLKIDVNDYEGYAGKANVYYQQRKYDQALPLFEMATVKNPAYLPLYETGMCRYAIDKKDEGVSDMKKYCEIYPKDDMTLYSCARLLYDMQRDSEALPYIDKAILLNDATPEYYMLRGYVNQVKKNWEAAIADYSKVITLNGNGKGEAYYKRGICRAEKYAVTKNSQDKKDFCSDMELADAQGISEAAQYLRELCD